MPGARLFSIEPFCHGCICGHSTTATGLVGGLFPLGCQHGTMFVWMVRTCHLSTWYLATYSAMLGRIGCFGEAGDLELGWCWPKDVGNAAAHAKNQLQSGVRFPGVFDSLKRLDIQVTRWNVMANLRTFTRRWTFVGFEMVDIHGGHLILDSSAFLNFQDHSVRFSTKRMISDTVHVPLETIKAWLYMYRMFLDNYLMQTRYTLYTPQRNTLNFLISLYHINSLRNTLALPKPWPFDESWQIPLELAELNSQEGLNELLEKVWNLGAQHSCAMFRFSNSATRVTKQLWDSYGVEGVERMSWCHA